MTLKICELISIVLSALVGGMYWGAMAGFEQVHAHVQAEVFLDIVGRMNRNMAGLMTVLVPLALLSIAPVLFFSYNKQPRTFYLNLMGFAVFIVALLVTVLVEVPIVKRIVTWTVGMLPGDWQQQRDRWGAFHIIRVVAGIEGLVLLVAGAIF